MHQCSLQLTVLTLQKTHGITVYNVRILTTMKYFVDYSENKSTLNNTIF